MELSQKILSDITIFTKYAKYLPDKNRRETWEEIVERNMDMHLYKFPHMEAEIRNAYKLVFDKKVLPSMRSIQFAGKPIALNNARLFNCSYTPINHIDAFSEIMFLLLSGCGVGYSVQTHHIDMLPEIIKPTKTRRYLVGDSIEGWSDAVKVLMSAYFSGKSLPRFDFRDIRPKGAKLITSGGKAPGPEPLKTCLHHIQTILDRKNNGEKLLPIEAHDICCFIADAVLSGGIRRSATICLFNIDDEEMLTCKFGNWYEKNPQRARANNSAVVVRHKITKDKFFELWKKVQLSNAGEPGIYFTNNKDIGTNPCAEVSLKPASFCNLTEINASDIQDQEDLNARARAAAFIGTLQASYTDFHYLRDVWKKTTEKDALIGVSMTGIASGVVLKLNMKEAAQVVKEENARVAALIGINKAARATTVKPSGTSSLVLGTSSGIHAWHDNFYIRRMRVNKNESIYSYLAQNHPELIEDEFFAPHKTAVIQVPQKAPDGAITRHETAIDLLNRVSKVYKEWIKPGHRKGDNNNNISTSITVKPDEWELVGQWMWEHQTEFSALSAFPYSGGTYIQTPFETIDKETYDELSKVLAEIDLTNVEEGGDETDLRGELACVAGGCEIG